MSGDDDYVYVSRRLLNLALTDFRKNKPQKFERLHYVRAPFCGEDFDEEKFFRWVIEKYLEDLKEETPFNSRQKMIWRFLYAGILSDYHDVMFTWVTGELRSKYARDDAALAAATAPVRAAPAAAAPAGAAGGAAPAAPAAAADSLPEESVSVV
jgi:hypothetical protein